MKHNEVGRWSQATTNIFKAIRDLIQAMKHCPDSYLAYIPNAEAGFPNKITNPLLDDPFNWTMNYGVQNPPGEDEIYINDTQKDLTLNWVASFGIKRSITRYRRYGILDKGLVKGMGTCFPLRKSDFLKLRTDLEPDFNLWTTHWKPLDGIEYWVPNPKVKRVYVVTNPGELDSCRQKPSWAAILLTLTLRWTKYLPVKSVLRMPEYRNITFRWGDVTHGRSIEFHIPKVFRWSS